MKPAYVALVPLGVLLAAATAGRLNASAAAGEAPPPPHVRDADAIAAYPRILRAARDVCLGPLPFKTAERAVLRALDERGGGGAPVSVRWVDDYGRLRVARRAVYDPARELLFYQTRATRPCVYDGVTRAGMEAALKCDTDAPIATAHTYSYPTLSAMAQVETN